MTSGPDIDSALDREQWRSTVAFQFAPQVIGALYQGNIFGCFEMGLANGPRCAMGRSELVAEFIRIKPKNACATFSAMIGRSPTHDPQTDNDNIVCAHVPLPHDRHVRVRERYQQTQLKRERRCHIVPIQD